MENTTETPQLACQAKELCRAFAGACMLVHMQLPGSGSAVPAWYVPMYGDSPSPYRDLAGAEQTVSVGGRATHVPAGRHHLLRGSFFGIPRRGALVPPPPHSVLLGRHAGRHSAGVWTATASTGGTCVL